MKDSCRETPTALPGIDGGVGKDSADKLAALSLISTYNLNCPSLPRCKGAPGSAAFRAALAAWRRQPDAHAWSERFSRAEASDFLTGRAGNDRPFRADLLWLCNPTNAEKVDLGRYDNRAGARRQDIRRGLSAPAGYDPADFTN